MEMPCDLAAFSHRNILVVDDEPSIHEMYRCFLQPKEESRYSVSDDGEVMVDSKKAVYNFNVFCVDSGQQALDACKTQGRRKAPIQMAFVDMRMPGWDGVETVKHLMEYDPRITFVIVTGVPDEAWDEIERRIGAARIQVIGKPSKGEEIYRTAYLMTKSWNRLHDDSPAMARY